MNCQKGRFALRSLGPTQRPLAICGANGLFGAQDVGGQAKRPTSPLTPTKRLVDGSTRPSRLALTFGVEGDPRAEPRVRLTRAGTAYASPVAQAWKWAVRAQCLAAQLRRAEEFFADAVPVAVWLRFRFRRPRSHYRGRSAARGLVARAPAAHVQKPDIDNLAKAVLDAIGSWEGCPSLVWSDDRTVDELRCSKTWAEEGQTPGVSVTICTAKETSEAFGSVAKEPAAPERSTLLRLEDLRAGECLEVDRRRALREPRKPRGRVRPLSAVDVAEIYGVTSKRYRAWENLEVLDSPRPKLGELALHEQCFVLRRRRAARERRSRAESLTRLAEELRMPALWVREVELGQASGIEALAQHWMRLCFGNAKPVLARACGGVSRY